MVFILPARLLGWNQASHPSKDECDERFRGCPNPNGLLFFDAADLAANRSGRLSDKQRKKLSKDDKSATRIILGLAALFFVLALIVLIIKILIPMARAALLNQSYTPANLSFPVVWGLAWAGLGCILICGRYDPLISANYQKSS